MQEEQGKQLKYEGVEVRIGDQQYIMPSLSVSQAKRYWPQLLELDNAGVTVDEMKSIMPKKFEDMVTVIHAALSRNYPDMTAEALVDIISISQVKSLMEVVMGQSGFGVGEAKPIELVRKVAVH